MLQDREEGELSSEEADVVEMRETREDLEEGEVDEGEHPAAAGYGQAHHSGGFQGAHSQQRIPVPKQQHQRLGKQQQQPLAKAKFRPEAMIVFGLHQLSPHALNTLVKRYDGTQWVASHPEPFEAFLGDKFNDAMIAHILQQVHTTHMTDPQNDAMLFFYFPTQTAKHKLLKFLKDLGIERLSTKSLKGVQIDVLLGAIGAPMAPVPPPPPVAPMPMEPGHYDMMPPNPWGMHDEFAGAPSAHHHPHHLPHHAPMHDLGGHAPYYYNVDVGVMHPAEAHMHPLAPPMAHVPPPAGSRWKRPRNVNAGPPVGAYDGPPRQHMLKKFRSHSQSRERHSEPESESPVELEQQQPERAAAAGGESQADLDQLRNLVLLSMARKASETGNQADSEHAMNTAGKLSPPPPSNGVQTVTAKPVRAARTAASPSPTPSSWSSSAETARPGAASNRRGMPAVPPISALSDTIEFTFKRTERVHRDLFDIYGAMNVAQLPLATCDAEFWPTKKSDAKPVKSTAPAVAGKQPNGTTAGAAATTVPDPVELKRQELLAKAEEMKRQIQLEEQKRKRKLTAARSQSSEQAAAPPAQQQQQEISSQPSSVAQTGRVDAESAAASTTKRHDTAAVPAVPPQTLSDASRPAEKEPANAIETVESPGESTVTQAESKEAEFERLKKREQQLKTEILIRQLKTEIDAHEAELKDALAKLAQARELLDGLHIATNEQEKLVSKLRVEKLELTQKAVKSDAYRIELLSELANARQAFDCTFA